MSIASSRPRQAFSRHSFQTDDAALLRIAAKVQGGERLSFEDGVALYRSGDILAVGRLANLVGERRMVNSAELAKHQGWSETSPGICARTWLATEILAPKRVRMTASLGACLDLLA
jgi:hypothetical protein